MEPISELLGVTQLLQFWLSSKWRYYYYTHSVTFHPTQVNTPHRNPSQTGRYSINLPRRDGRLSWSRWSVTYWDGLPARRRSPIPVLTQQCTAGSRICNLLITSPTPKPLQNLPRPSPPPNVIGNVPGNELSYVQGRITTVATLAPSIQFSQLAGICIRFWSMNHSIRCTNSAICHQRIRR